MSADPSQELTFEQSLVHLEQIVRDLEDAQLGLEDALGRYELGVRLLKECHARLQHAEQRILIVTGVEEGQPVLQSFKHEASAPGKGASSPRLRRKPDDTIPF